ncbi:VacJ family lipoprotein [Gammaproteobacteria bacterium]|nr:VacJ family lipoprotein [Gammaproteobacteria bacterium]
MNIETKVYGKRLSPIAVLILLTSFLILPNVNAQSYDPWRNTNQRIFAFNDYFDQLLVRPITLTYTSLAPRLVRQGVGNFFSNSRDINIAANNALQFKFQAAISDAGRVVINSTIGVAGIFDVASSLGLDKHEEDFGQTFGAWGLDTGPYLVLPVFGSSNLRDALGLVLDTAFNPIQYLEEASLRLALFSAEEIDSRSRLLALDELVSGDKYIFFREASIQNREYLVNDGQIEDEFGDF